MDLGAAAQQQQQQQQQQPPTKATTHNSNRRHNNEDDATNLEQLLVFLRQFVHSVFVLEGVSQLDLQISALIFTSYMRINLSASKQQCMCVCVCMRAIISVNPFLNAWVSPLRRPTFALRARTNSSYAPKDTTLWEAPALSSAYSCLSFSNCAYANVISSDCFSACAKHDEGRRDSRRTSTNHVDAKYIRDFDTTPSPLLHEGPFVKFAVHNRRIALVRLHTPEHALCYNSLSPRDTKQPCAPIIPCFQLLAPWPWRICLVHQRAPCGRIQPTDGSIAVLKDVQACGPPKMGGYAGPHAKDTIDFCNSSNSHNCTTTTQNNCHPQPYKRRLSHNKCQKTATHIWLGIMLHCLLVDAKWIVPSHAHT